jgi:hypothetical protein
LWDKRTEVVNLVAAGAQDNDRDPQTSEVLLANEVLVHGEKDLKLRVGNCQEPTVAETQPVHLADDDNFMASQQASEALGQTLVVWDALEKKFASKTERESQDGTKSVKHIEFKGERLDMTSVRKWRDKMLKAGAS